MHYQAIADRTLKDGGVTVTMRGGIPFWGYAVNIAGTERDYFAQEFSGYDVAAYVQRNYRTLGNRDVYLGTWRHGDAVQIACCKVYLDQADAQSSAILNAQGWIFDLETDAVVPVVV